MLIKLIIFVLSISFFSLVTQMSYGQSEEKNFTAPKFGLSMKYPPDWTYVPSSVEEPNATEPVSYNFCPSSYQEKIANVLSCSSDSPVFLFLHVYKLENGTTLKEFLDQGNSIMENAKDLVGSRKDIDTRKINISGLTAIQTIDTCCAGGKGDESSFDCLEKKFPQMNASP